MRVLAVVLLVVLAGCPAVGPQESGDVTATPETYPPGVSASGVTDSTALARAHTTWIENRSYTLVSNRTIRYSNGTLASRLATTVELSRERHYRVSAETAGPDGPLFLGKPPASAEYWSNGTVYVRALTRGDDTVYNQFTPPDNFVGTWRYWRSTVPFGGQEGHARETYEGIFRDVSTAVVGTRTENGTTVYRLVGDSARSSSFAKVGPGPVGNVSLDAAVTEAGLIRRVDISYVTFVGNRSAQVDWTIQYRNVGTTTTERPDWYDRAVGGG